MRGLWLLVGLVGLTPLRLSGQDAPPPGADSRHVAVEASTIVVDEARMRRLGLDGVVLSSADAVAGVTLDRGASSVRVGSRVGGLDVSAWLDLARRERAVRRESTQRILVLSGSEAQLSSHRTLVGAYGGEVSAGPGLWVEPVVLEDGRVRLRLWTATGDVRAGCCGALEQSVPVEARTEIIVPSGTPLLVASSESAEERTRRGLLERGSTRTETRVWIVVTPRVVDDPAKAFPLPGEVPGPVLRR